MKHTFIFILVLSLSITRSYSQSCNDTLRTSIKGFAFGHSLFNHALPPIPAHAEFTSTGYWLGILAQMSGTQSNHGGIWGQFDSWNNIWTTNGGPPERLDLNYTFSSNNGDEEFWPWDNSTFLEQEFNLFYYMAPNFAQTWQPDPQYYRAEATQLLDNIHSVYPEAPIYLYVHWPKPELAADHFGTTWSNYANLADAEFAIYNEYTSDAYWEWHKQLYEMLVTDRPDYNLHIIPVGQVIADVLETSPYLASINFSDLYHDDAPHGLSDLYFLAGLVTYRAIYGRNPDVSSFTLPSGVPPLHPDIADNLEILVQDMEARFDEYCVSSVGIADADYLQAPLTIYPNPSGDFIYVKGAAEDQREFRYQISDLSGRVLKVGYANFGERVDVGDLGVGMYFVYLEMRDGVRCSLKLIKD